MIKMVTPQRMRIIERSLKITIKRVDIYMFLLLTGFEGYTVNYGLHFSPSIFTLGP